MHHFSFKKFNQYLCYLFHISSRVWGQQFVVEAMDSVVTYIANNSVLPQYLIFSFLTCGRLVFLDLTQTCYLHFINFGCPSSLRINGHSIQDKGNLEGFAYQHNCSVDNFIILSQHLFFISFVQLFQSQRFRICSRRVDSWDMLKQFVA